MSLPPQTRAYFRVASSEIVFQRQCRVLCVKGCSCNGRALPSLVWIYAARLSLMVDGLLAGPKLGESPSISNRPQSKYSAGCSCHQKQLPKCLSLSEWQMTGVACPLAGSVSRDFEGYAVKDAAKGLRA